MTTKTNLNKYVPVKLAGKKRTFFYDLKAIFAFEKESGMSIYDDKVWKNPSFTLAMYLIWAGLVHEEKTLKVDDLMDKLSLPEIQEALPLAMEAWLLNSRKPEPEGKATALEVEPEKKD